MPASYTAGLTRQGIATLCMLSGFAATAWAADHVGASVLAGQVSDVDPDPAVRDFNIPAQALTDALKQYAGLTLQSTMFRSEIVAGKTSSAVHGIYPVEAALHLLLAGTGLAVDKIGFGPSAAFVLKAEESTNAIAAPQASPPALAGYPTLLQARILDTLCNDRRTAPGRYRMLLRFRVDGEGRVRQPTLLNSTGDAGREAAVLEVLQRVQLEVAPPPDMPQPVAMLILPRSTAQGAARQCAAGTS